MKATWKAAALLALAGGAAPALADRPRAAQADPQPAGAREPIPVGENFELLFKFTTESIPTFPVPSREYDDAVAAERLEFDRRLRMAEKARILYGQSLDPWARERPQPGEPRRLTLEEQFFGVVPENVERVNGVYLWAGDSDEVGKANARLLGYMAGRLLKEELEPPPEGGNGGPFDPANRNPAPKLTASQRRRAVSARRAAAIDEAVEKYGLEKRLIRDFVSEFNASSK